MRKKIFFISILFMLILLTGVSVKADNENVEYTKETMSNYDGSIRINLSNMTLDTSHKYSFGISTEKSIETTEYHEVTENITESTMKILLDTSKQDIKTMLRKTDTVYLWIKDTTSNSNVLSDYEVNVKLNYSQTFKVFQQGNLLWQMQRIYDINNMYYSTVTITDKDIIKKYETLKENINQDSIILNTDTEVNNNNNIDKLGTNFSIPSSWNSLKNATSAFNKKEPVLPFETVPHDANLYLVWVKAKDSDSKEVYGYFLVNRLPNGGLKANVKYNPTEQTTESVQATITANREIQSVEGWILSEDKTSLTKKYTENTNEKVIVKDLSNNSVEIEVNVSNIMKQGNNKPEDNNNPNNSVTEPVDNTIANGKIPQTGTFEVIVMASIAIISITAIIIYIKYKNCIK